MPKSLSSGFKTPTHLIFEIEFVDEIPVSLRKYNLDVS